MEHLDDAVAALSITLSKDESTASKNVSVQPDLSRSCLRCAGQG